MSHCGPADRRSVTWRARSRTHAAAWAALQRLALRGKSQLPEFTRCVTRFIGLFFFSTGRQSLLMQKVSSPVEKVYKLLFEPKLTTFAGEQDLKCSRE